MSRRSPASNCKRSQDSFSPQPIALKAMLSRQDDDDDDDDEFDRVVAGRSPVTTQSSSTRTDSTRRFGIAAASGWQRGVKSCAAAPAPITVATTAGATR